MGNQEVDAFLTHLAVDLQVSASTQNQALSGLMEALQLGVVSTNRIWRRAGGR